jgi:hypothetical protein
MQLASRPFFSIVIMVAAICAGCATGARQQRPGRGSLTVGVTTTPPAAATLTFRVTVEPAGIAGAVKADAGVFNHDGLPFGDHVVRLSDLPAACQVAGGAERKISISEQRRFAVLRFDVRCN